jgi:pyruvate/2-oxoglutarate dehydrogenase complex dihydrolipoamide dehydrogenase (E3) component
MQLRQDFVTAQDAVDEITADICVIGAGSGGLSVASGAAQLGRKVVLVEKGEMGGDCLNAGCVPSKALIAAARAAHAQRSGEAFGVKPVEPFVYAPRVRAHIRDVIDAIAPNDSQERFEKLGVHVIRAPARFLDKRTVAAGNHRIRARHFVIATGSRPFIPDLPGLANVPYLTNETIFNLDIVPAHLIVLGGGTVGLELAQAYRRLGASVTVIEPARMLARIDRTLAQIVFDRLRSEGIQFREGTKIHAIERSSTGVRVEIARVVQGQETIEGSHLLVATGRVPNVEELDLAKARVQTDARGIKVNARLKTRNRRIYAIGDVSGAPQFTHVAGWHASLVIRNLLFRLGTHTDYARVPEVLYTDPEIATVGVKALDAKKRRDVLDVLVTTFEETDRGRTDRIGETLVRIVIGRKARVLGAEIVAPNAGELILPWAIAIAEGIPLSRLAELVVPYPTLGDHIKRITGAYYAPRLFSKSAKRLVSVLARLP